MNSLFSTAWRRLVFSGAVMLFAFLVMFGLSMSGAADSNSGLSIGDWMKRLFFLPGLAAAAAFLLSTALVLPASAKAAPAAVDVPSSSSQRKPLVAQVVGLAWLNPLQRRDYPTEWQLLWTMGLVRPNEHDDMVKIKPEKYSKLQSIGALAYSNQGRETFDGYFEQYIDTLLPLFSKRYFMGEKYFYTVKPDNKGDWRELAGIRVELAASSRLASKGVESYLSGRMRFFFEIGNPSARDLWSRNVPPDVQVMHGGANAGFTSLNRALDYLQANPDKSVWVMNWDAPNYPPKDGQINENLALLILVGPDFKTEREPLAWIGRAASSNAKDFEAKVGTTRAVQAWKASISQAAQNAGVPATSISFIVHDAGRGSDASSTRIGSLSHALTETVPEYDFNKQTFNTSALLGDMGAGSALTDVALAIARANHLGGNVLVAGATDANHPTAVVVVPPSKLTPINADKDWFRARGESNAYLPWWGRRHDAKSAMQGYSE